MIVVDSSAIIAILLKEQPAEALTARIAKESTRSMSVATYLEAGAVLAGRLAVPLEAIDILDDFVSNWHIDLIPVDAEQARVALKARIQHGRGFGASAKLNFGDCFSYALAKAKFAPLLYVGNDFDKTDVKRA
jgi:ribonuclease VapC